MLAQAPAHAQAQALAPAQASAEAHAHAQARMQAQATLLSRYLTHQPHRLALAAAQLAEELRDADRGRWRLPWRLPPPCLLPALHRLAGLPLQVPMPGGRWSGCLLRRGVRAVCWPGAADAAASAQHDQLVDRQPLRRAGLRVAKRSGRTVRGLFWRSMSAIRAFFCAQRQPREQRDEAARDSRRMQREGPRYLRRRKCGPSLPCRLFRRPHRHALLWVRCGQGRSPHGPGLWPRRRDASSSSWQSEESSPLQPANMACGHVANMQ